MTSKLTRERLQEIAEDGFLKHGESKELARIALAAMDSEPVAWINGCNKSVPAALRYLAENPRPIGGESSFNTAHLYQLAREIELMAEAPLYRHAQPASEREQVRRQHAEWSQATFGNVGPVGPLKHLSKEALEAAAAPGDLSEWADMQFLMWDAQRRAGITDEQITQAMVEKLAVNKRREWPEPKDGEPRLHIKEQPAPVVPEGLNPETTDLVLRFASALADKLYKAEQKYGRSTDWMKDDWYDDCLQSLWEHIEKGDPRDVAAYCAFMWHHGWVTTDYDRNVQNACRAAMLQAGNSPVIPDGLIGAVNRLLDSDGSRGCYSAIRCGDAHDEIERLLAAAPQEVK